MPNELLKDWSVVVWNTNSRVHLREQVVLMFGVFTRYRVQK